MREATENSLQSRLRRELQVSETMAGIAGSLLDMSIPEERVENFLESLKGAIDSRPIGVEPREIIGALALGLVTGQGGEAGSTISRDWIKQGKRQEVLFDSRQDDPLLSNVKMANHRLKWVKAALSTDGNDQRLTALRLSHTIRFASRILDVAYGMSVAEIKQNKYPTESEVQYLRSNSVLQSWLTGFSMEKISSLQGMEYRVLRAESIDTPLEKVKNLESSRVSEVFDEAVSSKEPVTLIIKPEVRTALVIESSC